ncbi:MAG: FKBP-type peptidyl-prolyl cis-trans isomerase [Clostridia bacterium]|nr:FKBP-type peptidyl-prolyl cis-trans isomerase [Clostridia bacterium]
MRKLKFISIMTMVILASTMLLGGCSGKKVLESTDEDFSYSYGIDDNGIWKDIKALRLLDLCEYEDIAIPAETHVIPDEDVQAEIDKVLADYSEDIRIKDRAVQDGDTVNIDYIGSIDGKEFEGGNTGGLGTDVTIGVTSYIDDFLEQLIGHMPGESFDIEVTFPVDYGNEELNGKDAVFAITVNYIIGRELPELTDAFVFEFLLEQYGWNTVSEMEEGLRSSLRDTAIEYYLQEYLLDNTVIDELPPILLEYQEFTMLQFYRNYANYYNVGLDEFLTSYMNVPGIDGLIESTMADNTNTAGLYLILQAIAEDAGIMVTDEEVAAYFEGYSSSGSFEDFKAVYGLPHLKMVTLQEKVLEHLRESMILE